MAKDTGIIFDGEVIKVLGGGDYEVKLKDMDMIVKVKPAGKMKMKMNMFKLKIIPGDWVQVELSEYDTSVGRIIFRYKSRPDNS